MKLFDCYENIIIEKNHFEERLRILEKYKDEINNEILNITEITEIQKRIINQIKKDLSELKGIDYNLYSKIVVYGINISKAIDQVSVEEEKDVSTLWKNYYPKIKKRLKKLDLLYEKKEDENEEN